VSEKVNIALATEVKKVVDELESLAKGKDVVVDNKVSGPFVLHVNNQELHILLMNLIKNAIKYNKK
jgi:signal transduction histidine kinase